MSDLHKAAKQALETILQAIPKSSAQATQQLQAIGALQAALAQEPAQPAQPAVQEPAQQIDGFGAGVAAAKNWVLQRCRDYQQAHGQDDPETGTTEYPGDGAEYVGELMEIVEGIEALAQSAQLKRLTDGHLRNPLADDGDALRLAVKLKLRIDICPWGADAYPWNDYSTDFVNCIRDDDPYAATRRAIVRAAAVLGEKP